MYDNIRIHQTEYKLITCRADLIQFILDLGRMYIGRPAIKIDKSLRPLLEAFNILFPVGGNGRLMKILKKDGVFEAVKHYEDSEHSSINTLFYDTQSYYTFVDNFASWLEKNDNTQKPIVEQESEQ